VVSSHGSTRLRPLVLVRLTDDEGGVGYGEAAPLQSYDGVSVDDVVAALEAWDGGADLPPLPQAAAALDLARWDLAGQRAGQPVWRLLGAGSAEPVEVNSLGEAPGFGCVKLKVGLGDDDLARVAAAREALGPAVSIRIDANGAWSVEQAIARLRELAPFGIELCEEPVHGVDELAAVAAEVDIPIAADESTTDPRLFERRVCAAVCLKVASSGGIGGLLRDAERARALDYGVYLASTFDGPLGIAAALHAAAVIRPDRPCGLATLSLFEAADPLPPEGGLMRAPSAPGLGVAPPCPI
jgi:L-alanine-DL-glutamate epimerase-like enolase superfamily enzyme